MTFSNSIIPQHDALKGSAILPHRSENVRMKLPRHPEPKPNKLEETSRGSKPILIARYNPSNVTPPRCRSLSMSGHRNYSPGSGGLFPRLISTGQYLQGEVSKSFPTISAIISSVVADVLNHCIRSFPLLGASDSNLARKDFVNERKASGVEQNVRIGVRVKDAETAHRASWQRRGQDGAHPPSS